MPLTDAGVVCLNHPKVVMQRNGGFSALTGITVTDEKLDFVPTTGIPLAVFFCEICGYVESYVGPKTGFWAPSEPTAEPKYRAFEKHALEFLRLNAESFGLKTVRSNVLLKVGSGQTIEVDAIGESDSVVMLFEIKATSRRRYLDVAAMNLRRQVSLCADSFPNVSEIRAYLIAPESAQLDSTYYGVPVIGIGEDPNQQVALPEPVFSLRRGLGSA